MKYPDYIKVCLMSSNTVIYNYWKYLGPNYKDWKNLGDDLYKLEYQRCNDKFRNPGTIIQPLSTIMHTRQIMFDLDLQHVFMDLIQVKELSTIDAEMELVRLLF